MEAIILLEGMAQMDFTRVTAMLAGTHWCKGIAQEEVQKAASHSTLVVGAFAGGKQIGFARVVSDQTRFAYLMDVIVDPTMRDHGVGQQLVEFILSHPLLEDVYQWMLVTTYAHSLYERCGFTRTKRAENLMEIIKPRPA